MQPFVKVMLADDHAILRKSLVNTLNSFENIRVIGDAGNGQELLDLLVTLNEDLPDVIVLDINMPVMDGYAAAQHIRKKWPLTKILALSMYDNEESIIKMLRCGVNGYVLKDIEPNGLQEAILHLTTAPFYYSDLVTGRLVHLAYNSQGEGLDISDREYEFLQFSCTELTYKEIAEKMFLSPRTIDGYRESLFRKLNITSRVGLAIYAIKTGLVKV